MFNRPQQPGNKGIIDNSADMIRHMVQLMAGLITPERQSRQHPHSRVYTKRYADDRQKLGGSKHYLLAQHVPDKVKPNPLPSAARRDLRGNHRPKHYWNS